MQAGAEELRGQIRAAFQDVAPPTGGLLLAEYERSEDATEMAAAFRRTHWSELPFDVLSYHREMLFALSAVGYRAYLPAYLMASLIDDANLVGEVGGHMLDGLALSPTSSETRVATFRVRMSLLSDAQAVEQLTGG